MDVFEDSRGSLWLAGGLGALVSPHAESGRACSTRRKSPLRQNVKKMEGNYFALQCLLHRCAYSVPLLQLHHADDSFLVLTTDGINFMVNSQEICDFVNQCHDPTEAAHLVIEQVMPGLL